MKIEAGKYYRTRDGRKVGPMEDLEFSDGYPWRAGLPLPGYWSDCGQRQRASEREATDLIAEWTDEPESTYNDADGLAYQRQNTPKPYLVPFKPNQRLSLEPIANGGWIVSAASPYYGQETERLGAFGSAADMLSALHDALTVSNGGDA